MESEAVWELFLASRDREDIPEEVRQSIGGAAKRLFPSRYRHYHDQRWRAKHPEEWKAKHDARVNRWKKAHPEKVREYWERASHGYDYAEYQRRYYYRNQERILARHRERWAQQHGPPKPRQPPMTPEERKAASKAAVKRYRQKIGRPELARREAARRARKRMVAQTVAQTTETTPATHD